MNILYQDVKTVSEYDQNQIFHLTRRNSNFRTSAVENYQTYGAVLLTRQDLGNFSTWTNQDRIDNFEVSFEISPDDYYDVHPRKMIEYNEHGVAVRLSLENAPVEIKILFIYNDHGFKGTYEKCRFWRA